MKPTPLLLACLLLTAAFNLALDLGQRARYASLTPVLAHRGSPGPAADRAFDARLDHLAEPGVLREIARVERARRQDDDRLLAILIASVDRMNGIGVWRGGLLAALALGALVASLRAGLRAPPRAGSPA